MLIRIVLVVLFVDPAALTAKSRKQTKQMQDNLINDLPEFIKRAHRGLPRLAYPPKEQKTSITYSCLAH